MKSKKVEKLRLVSKMLMLQQKYLQPKKAQSKIRWTIGFQYH